MSLVVSAATGTDLFVGSEDRPRQIARVTIEGARAGALVRIHAGDESDAREALVDHTGAVELECPLLPDHHLKRPGAEVDFVVSSGTETVTHRANIRAGEPGFTLHLIPHFHYDPVWWSTQAAFTSDWEDYPVAVATREIVGQLDAFSIIRMHLELAAANPEYTFVVAEVDYLQPWWNAFAELRELMVRLIEEGRVEVLGGAWNEPSSTLVSSELVVRNVLYGMEFQRGVMGANPTTAWQLDVFGHDPQYPGIMSSAGLQHSSWARGPQHEWGTMITLGNGGHHTPSVGLQFPMDFDWVAPSGRALRTSFMAAFYDAGWWSHYLESLAEAERYFSRLFDLMRPVAATHNILIPDGTDNVRPNTWVLPIVNDWSGRYVWPKVVSSTPSRYFARVDEEVAQRGYPLSAQTRDMNPLFEGTAVSYIDTKQAHRAAEVLLAEAETFATFAWAEGLAAYPKHSLDLAWRQLIFASHHDAITGSESDQVYLDLLGSWREAWQIGSDARASSLAALAAAIPARGARHGGSLAIFNGVSWNRGGPVRVLVESRETSVTDGAGRALSAVVDRADDDGVILTVLAPDIPALGRGTFALSVADHRDDGSADSDSIAADGDDSSAGAGPSGWIAMGRNGDAATIENESFRITVDKARGGGVASVIDTRTNVELITDGRIGNELLLYDEYDKDPHTNALSPWHVLPKGPPIARSSDTPAVSVVSETSEVGQRIRVQTSLGTTDVVQTITLWNGVERIECSTEIRAFAGSDQLIRLAWPCEVPGALPVAETSGGAVGRNFGHPHRNSAEVRWGQDSAAFGWFGLSRTASFHLSDMSADGDPATRVHAFGIAEIISATDRIRSTFGRDLAVALAASGVTSTTSLDTGNRYGNTRFDSNHPDIRIVLGGPDENTVARAVLDEAPPEFRAEYERQRSLGDCLLFIPAAGSVRAVSVPNADVTATDSLAVLLIAGDLERAIAAIAGEIRGHSIRVSQRAPIGAIDESADRTVALLNRGIPGYAVGTDGTLYLSLLRSSTGWPSGVWVQPPARTAPDGAGFQLQHWAHTFEYALVAGSGDWRAARVSRQAREFNHDLTALVVPHETTPGTSRSYLRIAESAGDVVVTAVKRADPADDDAIVVRLAETAGSDATVSIESTLKTTATTTVDLFEKHDSPPAPSQTGGNAIGRFDLQTFRLSLQSDEPRRPVRPMPDGASSSKYWRTSAGAAPLGNQPVSVHLPEALSPHPAAQAADGPAMPSPLVSAVVKVVDSDRMSGSVASLSVVLLTPDAARSAAESGPWVYERELVRGAAGFDVDVPVDSALSGQIALRVEVDIDGRRASDCATYALESGQRLTSIQLAEAVSVEFDRSAYWLRAGENEPIGVLVTNRSAHRVEGRIQVLSPWGTWESLPDWTGPVVVEPHESTRLEFTPRSPTGLHGIDAWILAKLSWSDAVCYSPSASLKASAANTP